MFDLSKHPYFTPYTDPKSGIVSYILTEKVAPLQRQFYFAQPSVTADGKYLWFLCFNPPARYMTLGVLSLDPENPFIKNFPYAAPQGGNPCVTPEGDGVYFGVGNIVCKLDIEGKLTKLITVGTEITHGRPIERLFTHASISADGKYIAPTIDAVLKENGVKENSFLKINLKSLENAVYTANEKISFVSIEKRGRKLIVETRLTSQKTEPIDVKKQAVLSTVSGEVVAINLLGGTAKVKVGDKVQKGSLLIDGYYDFGDKIIKTYALGEVLIKAEFKFDYKSFTTGEKYKNRAVFLAKQSLGLEEIVGEKVEQKKENGRIIYSVTLYYLVVVG